MAQTLAYAYVDKEINHFVDAIVVFKLSFQFLGVIKTMRLFGKHLNGSIKMQRLNR